MATTTNFGWETPDDTDLVKDGAAAMRTLGNSIDTSFVDLKGGTTNQVLAKNSNTDLDFKWVADATGIPATIIDAKGDLIAGTAADTAARLAIGGTNGHVLQVDSNESTGMKWAAAPAANKSFSLVNAGGTALTGAATITVNVSGYDTYFVVIDGASSANTGFMLGLRLNGSSANYFGKGNYLVVGSTYSSANYGSDASPTSYLIMAQGGNSAANTVNATALIQGANSAGAYKIITSNGGGTGTTGVLYWMDGYWNDTSTVSSISAFSSSGNFDAGTMYIYGSS